MLKTILFLSLLVIAVCAFVRIDVNDEDVLAAANFAAKSLSKTFASKYHHRLTKVLKAESQGSFRGADYRMDIVVGMTTCKKAEVQFEDAKDCDFQEGISTYKKCTVVVNKGSKGEFKLVTTGCILATKKDLEDK